MQRKSKIKFILLHTHILFYGTQSCPHFSSHDTATKPTTNKSVRAQINIHRTLILAYQMILYYSQNWFIFMFLLFCNTNLTSDKCSTQCTNAHVSIICCTLICYCYFLYSHTKPYVQSVQKNESFKPH